MNREIYEQPKGEAPREQLISQVDGGLRTVLPALGWVTWNGSKFNIESERISEERCQWTLRRKPKDDEGYKFSLLFEQHGPYLILDHELDDDRASMIYRLLDTRSLRILQRPVGENGDEIRADFLAAKEPFDQTTLEAFRKIAALVGPQKLDSASG